jgi:hypothetical protein
MSWQLGWAMPTPTITLRVYAHVLRDQAVEVAPEGPSL